MKSIHLPNRLFAKAISLLVLFGSVSVFFPLLFYLWLCGTSLFMPQRLDRMLDVYSTLWSLAALVITIFNFRETVRPINNEEVSTKLPIVVILSVFALATCPGLFF